MKDSTIIILAFIAFAILILYLIYKGRANAVVIPVPTPQPDTGTEPVNTIATQRASSIFLQPTFSGQVRPASFPAGGVGNSARAMGSKNG